MSGSNSFIFRKSNSLLLASKKYKKNVLLIAGGSSVSCYYMFYSTTSSVSFLDSNSNRNTNINTSNNDNNNDPTTNNNTYKTPILLTRSEQINKLQTEGTINNPYDILVVGGGVTGCGIALDSITRNLKTALIERYDFSNETSSKSTKLLWAGIRYIATSLATLLQWKNIIHPINSLIEFKNEFNMVLGAHKERSILLNNNPHLTNWVPIAIPISQWLIYPNPPFNHILFSLAPITLPLVMKFYDSLSNFNCPPSHIMNTKRSIRKFPQLNEKMKYFQIFYEGQHNDSRTNTYIALTASEYGANVANYVEMIEIITDENTGKAIGIKCRDNLNHNKEFNIYSKSIIFAGGPFTDQLRKIEDKNYQPIVNPTGGTHILLPGYYCPGGFGMLDINTSDGRFLFFLPWEGSTLVGTTDRKDTGSGVTSYHGPPEDEINWLLNELQKYLSKDIIVRRSDVLSAWQGFRPLVLNDPNKSLDEDDDGKPISRDHMISTNPKTGITFIAGGKWVTYREMAQDVLDDIINTKKDIYKHATKCITENIILRGGVGYNRNLPIQLVQKYNLNENTAKHLARNYGIYAYDVCELVTPTSKNLLWPKFNGNIPLINGYPYIESEIIYQCRYEMCVTVKDMLTLRFRLAYLNKDATLSIVQRVTDIMAKELNWSKTEKLKQYNDAIELINTFGGSIPVIQEQESTKDTRTK